MARMRSVILASAFIATMSPSCTSKEAALDGARVQQCVSIIEKSKADILSRAAIDRPVAFSEAMPEDCQTTDVYKTVEAGLLIDLGRMDDAGATLNEIDLLSTNVPRALEMAYILAVEGGWQSPVEPTQLASRYIDLWPDSPIGYVLLARELSHEKRDREMLDALAQAKRLVTPANERAFLAHLVTFAGYYFEVGEYAEAYRLDYLLFSLYGDEVWVRDSSVISAAVTAIAMGRRDEAKLIMDRLIQRNPQAGTTAFAMTVMKELIEQKEAPRAMLSPDQPTIESLLRTQTQI